MNELQSTIYQLMGTFERAVEGHPKAHQFTSKFSDQDFLDLVTESYERLKQGIPLGLPSGLVSRARELLSREEQRNILQLLGKWSQEVLRARQEPLSRSELQYLEVGLLWITLLLTEYRRRFVPRK